MVGDAPHAAGEVVGRAKDESSGGIKVERVHSLIASDESPTRFKRVSCVDGIAIKTRPTNGNSVLTFADVPQLHLAVRATRGNDSVHRRPPHSVHLPVVRVELKMNLVGDLVAEVSVANCREGSLEQIVALAQRDGTRRPPGGGFSSRFRQLALHRVILLSGKE